MRTQDLMAIILQGFISAVNDENHISHKSFKGMKVIPHSSKLGVCEILLKDGSGFVLEVASDNVIWYGLYDGMHCRICQVAPNDCIVERRDDIDLSWSTIDDDLLCSQVYMTAFLEAHKNA